VRNWKNLLIAVLLAAVCVLGFLYVIGAQRVWYSTPRKVADVPGPAGSDRAYELQYAPDGDLVLRPVQGNPVVTHFDYYGDTNVVKVHWPATDRVEITMRDGTLIRINVGFRVEFPRTRPAGAATQPDFPAGAPPATPNDSGVPEVPHES
jgi:hypothetical protein